MNKGELVRITVGRPRLGSRDWDGGVTRVAEMCPDCRPESEWNRRQSLIKGSWRRQCCGERVA